MHPTVQMNHRTNYSVFENHLDPITKKTVISNVIAKIDLRTNEMYQQQVIESLQQRKVFQGIKGFSYLSNWIRIPEDVVYDYMHLSLLGTFKAMFNNFFDSCNHKEPYYLSKLN